jgi:type VI secretion system protein ImpI
MGKGLRVHVTNAQDGGSFERTFDDFPIRIGRDPLNELPLDYPFVSKFHAVLDLRGDRVLLRDLGSRNGTSLEVPTERIAPNEPVDLARTQNTFGIATLRFSVSLVEIDRASSTNLRRARGGAILSHVPESSPPPPAERVATASGIGGDAVRAAVDDARSDVEAWQASWGRLYSRISRVVAALPAEQRARLVHLLVQEHPGLAYEPDFRRLAEHLGVALEGEGTGSREESVALLVLRDLASWYVDAERAPRTAAQLVAFGRKLQDVLDALFVSFLPLRDGMRRFESEFDVKVGVATYAGGQRAPAEAAKTPAELAARLLDWHDPNDSGRIVRRVFTDLMVHNVGLVNGVMRGAAALLAQLAPEALEKELEADRAAGKTGLVVGPLKFRALWDVLKRRHSDLASEEQERFALLFGAEFASAYSALTTAARHSKTPEILRHVSDAGAQRAPGSAAPPPPAAPSAPPAGPTGTVIVDESRPRGGGR